MNRKSSMLLSLGVSAVLIAAAIWFLSNYNAAMWPGGERWGMGYNHMMGGGMGIMMIIFWIVLIGALVLLISGAANGIRGSQKNIENDPPRHLEILKERYASGEINKAEFEEMRQELSG
jgi:putative membrane protein